MLTWNHLIGELNLIDWEGLDESNLQRIGDLLRSTDRDALLGRFLETIEDSSLYQQYAPHTEFPRPLMDKFVLYMDVRDRFRVRLHRFKPRSDNRGEIPWIHDHRWYFVSLVLAGSYVETLYDVLDEDDENHAKLVVRSTRLLEIGSLNVMGPREPHSTVNGNEIVPCYTLFIRGPSRYEYSRIFDLQSHSYRRSWGLRDELLVQYSLAASSIGRSNLER